MQLVLSLIPNLTTQTPSQHFLEVEKILTIYVQMVEQHLTFNNQFIQLVSGLFQTQNPFLNATVSHVNEAPYFSTHGNDAFVVKENKIVEVHESSVSRASSGAEIFSGSGIAVADALFSVIFYVPFSVVNKVSGGDFYGVARRPAAIESAIVEGRDFQCVLGTQSLQSRCNPFPDVLRLLECAGNIFFQSHVSCCFSSCTVRGAD